MTQKVLIFSCFFQNISFKRLLTHFPPRVTGTYHATNWHITLVQQEYHNSSAVHITHHRCISLLRSKNITTAPPSISRTTGAYHVCVSKHITTALPSISRTTGAYHVCVSKHITTALPSISRTTGAYHSCAARISRQLRCPYHAPPVHITLAQQEYHAPAGSISRRAVTISSIVYISILSSIFTSSVPIYFITHIPRYLSQIKKARVYRKCSLTNIPFPLLFFLF